MPSSRTGSSTSRWCEDELMSPRSIRFTTLAICAVGTAGMIATQIAGRNDATIALGLVTTGAAVVLIATTSATSYLMRQPRIDTDGASLLESRIDQALARGIDEEVVGELVQAAIEFGRESSRRT